MLGVQEGRVFTRTVRPSPPGSPPGLLQPSGMYLSLCGPQSEAQTQRHPHGRVSQPHPALHREKYQIMLLQGCEVRQVQEAGGAHVEPGRWGPEGLKGPLHSLPPRGGVRSPHGPLWAHWSTCPLSPSSPLPSPGQGCGPRNSHPPPPTPLALPPAPACGHRRTLGPLGRASALWVASQEGPWPHATGSLGLLAQPGTQVCWPRTRAVALHPPGAGAPGSWRPLQPVLASRLRACCKSPNVWFPNVYAPTRPLGCLPSVGVLPISCPHILQGQRRPAHGRRAAVGQRAEDGRTDGRVAGFPTQRSEETDSTTPGGWILFKVTVLAGDRAGPRLPTSVLPVRLSAALHVALTARRGRVSWLPRGVGVGGALSPPSPAPVGRAVPTCRMIRAQDPGKERRCPAPGLLLRRNET